jgi:hypothetical protein
VVWYPTLAGISFLTPWAADTVASTTYETGICLKGWRGQGARSSSRRFRVHVRTLSPDILADSVSVPTMTAIVENKHVTLGHSLLHKFVCTAYFHICIR